MRHHRESLLLMIDNRERSSVSNPFTEIPCDSRFDVDVLIFPLAAGLDLSAAAVGERVGISALVERAFLDETRLNQFIEVWVQPP